MGKKISPASSLMKISKNHNHHQEKKQFNSLLKVLRPKVYITDTSSFKSLVQQLTGLEGGNTVIDHISSSPPQAQLDHRNISIIDIDQDVHEPVHHLHLHDHEHPDDESNSMELATSSDYASVDSFEHMISCNQQPVSFTEEVNQLEYDQMYQLDDEIISESLLMNQQQQQQKEEGFWGINQDMESWLLDMESYPNISYNGCCYSQIQQEVSIYDYELSGLI